MSRRNKRKKQDKEGLFAATPEQESKPSGGSDAGVKLSRTTIHRYRQKGYDVGEKGSPDYEKAAAIHEQEKHKERDGSQQSKESQYWNDRYRKTRALSAEMELSVAMGKLVSAVDVEHQAFQVYRDVRDAMRNIPSRIAGAIAAELQLEVGAGQEKVFLILTKEIDEALAGLGAHGVR